MSVKQFSASYVAIEDRIVLSLNTTEGELFFFILTRAVTCALLNQAEMAVEQSLASQHSVRSSKVISEFQKEGLKKQINFQENFEGGTITPLGKDPILVCQVTLDVKPELISIGLTLLSNQVVGFALPPVQLQAFCLLLERLARQAHWGFGTEVQASSSIALGTSAKAPQLH